jgi:outer membrane protein OmpA-like peptidoglycan-associated protein
MGVPLDPELIALDSESKDQLNRLYDLLIDLQAIDAKPSQSNQQLQYLEELWQSSASDYFATPVSPDSEPNPNQVFPKKSTPAAQSRSQQPQRDRSATPASNHLQELIVGLKFVEVHDLLDGVNTRINHLDYQVHDPEELMELMLPWIAELLSRKVSASQTEMVEAIAPIIDSIIESRATTNAGEMSHAIAPIITPAIREQVLMMPDEIARAIAPVMGQAMKEQVALAEEKVVDALYPIIGNTVGKYLGETIKEINERIENSLSVKGIQRKIHAKLKGMSEAELILQDAMFLNIQAAFLIHQSSGLLISEAKQTDEYVLESEMLAGMLTAIRSFVNDCIAQSGQLSDLSEIDYGRSKILLESAGHCYLAVVIEGSPTKTFIAKIRKTMATLVRRHSKSIEQFTGDPETIPEPVHTLVQSILQKRSQKDSSLTEETGADSEQKDSSFLGLSPLVLLCLGVVGIITLPLGIWQFMAWHHRTIEASAIAALTATPELSVYNLDAQVNWGELQLIGRVPNAPLRQKAEQVVHQALPNQPLENKILTIEVPADPVLTAAEVNRVTQTLNQVTGTAIATHYVNEQVTIAGNISTTAAAKLITQTFEQIPGIKKVSTTLLVQPAQLETRFYFEPDSAALNPNDRYGKIPAAIAFLNQYPTYHLSIKGYSSGAITPDLADPLAIDRAESVRQAMIDQGIDPARLHIAVMTELPEDLKSKQPDWRMRCVILEPIVPPM